jgi:hypothetical protein
MNKIEFVDSFNKVCSELNLELEPYIEYGIKLSDTSINTDKVNISFKSEKITKEQLLDIIPTLFTKFDNVKKFIDNVYNDHKDKIKQIFIGSSNGNKEIYFEVFEPGDSSTLVSYDEGLDQLSTYLPLHDSKVAIDSLTEFIFDKTGLIIPEPYEYFKGGFVKNKNIYYILVLEPLQSLKYVLTKLVESINPQQSDIVTEWFENNNDYQLDNIAYSISGDNINLNIYISKQNEPRTTEVKH